MNNNEEEPITCQQLKSLNLWCGQIAEALKEQGYDIREQLTAPLIPTKYNVKEFIFKRLAKSMFGVDSTKDLKKKKEIDELADVITKMFGDMGKSIPNFPSEDELYYKNLK